MKQTLLIALLFTALHNYGQQVIVKLSPLALADFINFPTIQAGVETRWHKIGWYNELGIQYLKNRSREYDTAFVPERGYKIKTELRYYITDDLTREIFGGSPTPRASRINAYVAANLFYIYDSHNTRIGYYANNDSMTLRTDNFGVKKTVLGFNILFGAQSDVSQRFIIDMYGGLGARFRNYRTSHKEIQEIDNIVRPIDFNIFSAAQQAEAKGGSSATINLTLGIRIGYRF